MAPKRKSDMPKRGQIVDPRSITKPSKLVELPVNVFQSDQRVQRNLNQARVIMMAEQFQPHSLGMVVASQREDGIYLLDGLHRIAAADMARYDGLVPTKLWEGLTLQEEAALFLTLNNSRAIQAIDMFKVRITLDDDAAVNINKILRYYGLHVDWSNTDSRRTVSAIVSLEKVYYGAGVRTRGTHADLVDRVLHVIQDAYGTEPERIVWSGAMLEGLGIFYATFGKKVEHERMVRVLQNVTPRQLIARARARKENDRGTLARNLAHVVHADYNHRHKVKLPEFHEVEPMALIPEDDPLYVDPNQFVRPVLAAVS